MFGPEDSGTANKPIVYASLLNQKPTISGGMKSTASGNLFATAS